MKKAQKTPEYIYLGISKPAREIYDNIAAKYCDKIDIELDFASLASYCESCIRLKKYYGLTNDKPPLLPGKNMIDPILSAISMQQKQINYLSDKLGLTPSSRHKIKMDLAALSRKSESKTGRKPNKKTLDDQVAEDAAEFC